MNLSDEVSLVVGARVGHAGEAWIIEALEDANRVLVRNVATSRREFLTVDQIGEPPPADLESVKGPDDNGPGRWTRRLAGRRLRGVEISKDDAAGNPRIKEAAKAAEQADRFEALTRILKLRGPEKKAQIEEYSRRFECGVSTVYLHLKQVQVSGKPQAIARAERSDRGSFRFSEKKRAVLVRHLDQKRFMATPSPFRVVCEDINVELNCLGEPSVSEGTLRKFAASLKSPKEVLESRGRKDQARNEHRPKVGHLPGANAPLRIVQIDHTPTQVVLVDEEHRLPISDAWLSIMIDSCTRMVLAFVLSFNAPSAATIGLLMGRAFLPKGDFLKKLGVPGEWPCYGIPGIIHVDGGKEMNGHFMHAVKRVRRFDLRNRPKGQPQFGGHVESAFSTYMKQLANTLPGTKFSNPHYRGDYDSEGHALLSIREFEACFAEWLVNQYHRSPHSGDGMKGRTPLQAWYDGVFVGDKYSLPIGLPAIPRHPDDLRISLLPIEHRTVNQGTVGLNTLTYYSIELERLSATLPSYADPYGKEARKFEVHHDPNNLTYIWLYVPSTKKYLRAKVQDPQWEDKSLWELREYRRRMQQPLDDDLTARVESRGRVATTISEASAKKTKAERSRREEASRQDANSIIPKKKTAGTGGAEATRMTADANFLASLKPR